MSVLLVIALAAGLGSMAPTRGAEASTAIGVPAVQLCGVANLASVTAPAASAPSSPFATIVAGLSVQSFALAESQLYVLTTGGGGNSQSVGVYSSSGQPVVSFAEPLVFPSQQSSIVVGPNGGIYIGGENPSSTAWEVAKFSPSGNTDWIYTVPGVLNGIFPWHDATGNFAVGVILRAQSSGLLLGTDGSVMSGSSPLPGLGNGEFVTETVAGNLLMTDATTVSLYSPAGQLLSTFGNDTAARSPNYPGAPLHFYQLGGAVQYGNTIYVADAGSGSEGHGIVAVNATSGVFEGWASDSAVGYLTAGSPLYQNGTNVYFANGGVTGSDQAVSSITIANLQALISEPKAPVEGLGQSLGYGAGLVSPATGNYFPPGTTPSIDAVFASWWGNQLSNLQLSYQVADRQQVVGHAWPAPTTVSLSAAQVASSGAEQGSYTLPLAIPASAAGPGVYLVNADLTDTASSTTVGSTCFTYSVGMPGDTLSFSSLAGSPNYGGPQDPVRGVQLAAELGTGLYREGLSWSTLLPGCDAASATATTCGPGAIQLAAYDPGVEQAAAAAQSLHVQFEVQLAEGGPTSTTLVQDGYWAEDVQALVAHYASVAPDLHAFEVWNEPNATWGSASSYVSEILAPAYQAIQVAEPGALVVGGTVVGDDLGYWQQIAAAGGFSDMNVVGVHPYPGYDRSFEEEGTPAFIENLKLLMAANGASSMPIWMTEMGYWSNTPYTFYTVADWTARTYLWTRALGIAGWNYFTTEGGYNSSGAAGSTSFSLIQAANNDDFVKPAGISLMTASTLTKGRPVVGFVATGIPHGYALEFGPRPGGSHDLLVAWADGFTVPAALTVAGTSSTVEIADTHLLGSTTTLSVSPSSATALTLSGAPQYLLVPAGVTLAVVPTESFGANLSLSSSGATATASSSQPSNPVSDAIAGVSNAGGAGGLPSTPAWVSAPLSQDPTPTMTVTLARPTEVDRVVVVGPSHASIVPSFRDYVVQAEVGGSWQTVATISDQFFQRSRLVSFPPLDAEAVRVVIEALDYGGTAGGLMPYYWTAGFPSSAVLYAVEVYAPGTQLAVTDPAGAGLGGTGTTTTSTLPTNQPNLPAGAGSSATGAARDRLGSVDRSLGVQRLFEPSDRSREPSLQRHVGCPAE